MSHEPAIFLPWDQVLFEPLRCPGRFEIWRSKGDPSEYMPEEVAERLGAGGGDGAEVVADAVGLAEMVRQNHPGFAGGPDDVGSDGLEAVGRGGPLRH